MSNVLIIEDSFTGLKGALASGARVLMVNNKLRQKEIEENQELLAQVEDRIDDLTYFKPEQFGLPKFD